LVPIRMQMLLPTSTVQVTRQASIVTLQGKLATVKVITMGFVK